MCGLIDEGIGGGFWVALAPDLVWRSFGRCDRHDCCNVVRAALVELVERRLVGVVDACRKARLGICSCKGLRIAPVRTVPLNMAENYRQGWRFLALLVTSLTIICDWTASYFPQHYDIGCGFKKKGLMKSAQILIYNHAAYSRLVVMPS